MSRKSSSRIVEFLKLPGHEGPVALTTYRCPKGIPTIGYGHTKGVVDGMCIDQATADQLLREDIAWAEEAVEREVKVALNQNQFDALVSFVFNIGEAHFQESTCLQLLNAGDYEGAADEVLKWHHVNHKDAGGLVKRRKEEVAIFNESILAN